MVNSNNPDFRMHYFSHGVHFNFTCSRSNFAPLRHGKSHDEEDVLLAARDALRLASVSFWEFFQRRNNLYSPSAEIKERVEHGKIVE